MEKRGQINAYQPYKWQGKPVFTINLADGVTPFMNFWDGKEYSSSCYRLAGPVAVTVTHGSYRPHRQHFVSVDASMQDHVLNGGLLCDPLALAVDRQLLNDDVDASWDYERFQAWCLEHYGKRRGPIGS